MTTLLSKINFNLFDFNDFIFLYAEVQILILKHHSSLFILTRDHVIHYCTIEAIAVLVHKIS